MAPRRSLVLGGTAWLGREIAARLLDRGDDVTCLARGTSAPPDGARLVAADRDAPHAYDGVAGTAWDLVVDLTRAADHSASAVAALGSGAARWVLVSTISVYADDGVSLVDPARDPDGYGSQKVLAERAVAELGDRALRVRAGLLAGPGDPTDRFGYWVSRLARAAEDGGDILVPPLAGRFSQVLDVRDLADYVTSSAGVGTVDAVGQSVPLAHLLDRAALVAGFTGRLRGRDDAWLLDHGVSHWSGERSLPLWLPPTDSAFLQRSDAGYLASGGRQRPLEALLLDVLADERARGLDRPRRAGLTRPAELDLLGAP